MLLVFFVVQFVELKRFANDFDVALLAQYTILDFRYQVVQLNNLDWRAYMQSTNPLAAALLVKMQVARRDRWRVKAASLRLLAGMPWPVVAQRNAPTALLDCAYIDGQGEPGLLRDGVTRLRSFLLRDRAGAAAIACGSHLTLTASRQVSESTEAVQRPVVFKQA